MKNFSKALIFILLSTACFITEASAGFSLSISPIRWEAAGESGKTLRKLIVLNSGSRAVQRVKVYAGDWTLSDNGVPVFAAAGSLPQSAAAWIRYTPEEFTVYPRQRKKIKASIKIPDGTLPGSYRAALFFEPPPSKNDTKPGSTSVFLRGRLAMVIYVTVGNARPAGEILDASWQSNLTREAPVPALKVQNRGNAHLRMNGFFTATSPAGNKYEGLVAALPILPGQSRWVPLEFSGLAPPPNTNLKLTLKTNLGQGERKLNLRLHGNKDS